MQKAGISKWRFEEKQYLKLCVFISPFNQLDIGKSYLIMKFPTYLRITWHGIKVLHELYDVSGYRVWICWWQTHCLLQYPIYVYGMMIVYNYRRYYENCSDNSWSGQDSSCWLESDNAINVQWITRRLIAATFWSNSVIFVYFQHFMSPRYPGGPRGPGVRMPDQFNVS